MFAYVEETKDGKVLVKVQTVKGVIFHSFDTKREFRVWKNEQKNMTFIR